MRLQHATTVLPEGVATGPLTISGSTLARPPTPPTLGGEEIGVIWPPPRIGGPGGRIIGIGETGAQSRKREDRTCDLRDHLIFAGLVNAHDHLHLNNFPPLPQDAPFPNSYAWMEAFQSYMEEPAVVAARKVPISVRCRHGALKNLLCGATTVVHHDPWDPIFDDPAFPVRLLRRYGWSHSLGLGLAETRRRQRNCPNWPRWAALRPTRCWCMAWG